MIGNLLNAKEVYICEGYATGATIHLATKKPVIVCFYAGNLLPVLEALKTICVEFIIAADNDVYKAKNTGKEAAEAISRKFGYKVLLPRFKDISTKPTDFNDLYCLEGIEEVGIQLKEEDLNVLNILEIIMLDIKEKESILHPILNEGGLAMIYAARGVGKTFVSLEIAFTVASGKTMFDGMWKADKPRKVLFIDGEMPAGTIKERLLAITARNNVEDLKVDNLQIITPDTQKKGMPDLSTKEGQNIVNRYITEDTAVVILDNISTLCRTGRENESESWITTQEWILGLRRRNIAVLLIHHAGKNGAQRGNSKKEDVLDTVINLSRPENYDMTEGARFEVHYTKARNFTGEDAKPFEAKLCESGWEVKDIRDEQDSLKAMILKCASEGQTGQEIAVRLQISQATVSRALKKYGFNNKSKKNQ